MSRTLFENSKAALAFAGITIIGAVAMVGTDETGGVLDQTVERFAEERSEIVEDAQAFAESQSVGDAPSKKVSDPDAGWGSSTAVFGDYTPRDELGGMGTASGSAARTNNAKGGAGVISGTPPVVPDSPGIPVSRSNGNPIEAAPQPVPVITGREMTITPQ